MALTLPVDDLCTQTFLCFMFMLFYTIFLLFLYSHAIVSYNLLYIFTVKFYFWLRHILLKPKISTLFITTSSDA